MPNPAPDATELAKAIRDFVYAVDRGDYGDALMVGPSDDRVESAYVAALRKAVEAWVLLLFASEGK